MLYFLSLLLVLMMVLGAVLGVALLLEVVLGEIFRAALILEDVLGVVIGVVLLSIWKPLQLQICHAFVDTEVFPQTISVG